MKKKEKKKFDWLGWLCWKCVCAATGFGVFWLYFLAIGEVFSSMIIGLLVASAMPDFVNSKKLS